jgi:hypothetical protein
MPVSDKGSQQLRIARVLANEVQSSSRRPAARPALGGFRSAWVSSNTATLDDAAGLDERRQQAGDRGPLLFRVAISSVLGPSHRHETQPFTRTAIDAGCVGACGKSAARFGCF